MLPIVATLIANGLGLVGNAVLAKGKDVIEKKLGIDIESALETDTGKQSLLQLQNDHEEFLVTSALEERKVELADVVSSRDANARIQESENSSFLAKNTGYILDYIIVLGTFFLAYLIFFVGIPQENKEIAFTAFGSLIAMCVTVVGWHRGSSSASMKKSLELSNLKGI